MDHVCRDVALVVEGFEAAEHAQVLSFLGLGLKSRGVCVAVNPLLYFN
jgi:hypothetical protein